MRTKWCESCRRQLPVDRFGRNKAKKDGYQGACKKCRRERHAREADLNKARSKRWRDERLEEVRENDRRRYHDDPEPKKRRAREYRKKNKNACAERDHRYYASRTPDRRKFTHLRANAKRRGIDFDLSLDNIQELLSSETCPVCGVRFIQTSERNAPHNRSIDRIDPAGIYTISNCSCICYRCNHIKGFGTADEHESIARWMRRRR